MPEGFVSQDTHNRKKNECRAWKAKAQFEEERAEQAAAHAARAEKRIADLEEQLAQYDMQRIDDQRMQDRMADELQRAARVNQAMYEAIIQGDFERRDD
jgi:hypothetical protein